MCQINISDEFKVYLSHQASDRKLFAQTYIISISAEGPILILYKAANLRKSNTLRGKLRRKIVIGILAQ